MNSFTRNSEHDEYRDLCAAYALEALDPPESAAFEKHLLEGCATCSSEIAEYRQTVSAIGSLMEVRSPPGGAEDRLMTRLAHQGKSTGSPTRARETVVSGRGVRGMALVAAVLLAAASLWIAVDARYDVARLKSQIDSFESTTDPIVNVYDLRATSHAMGGRARVTFDPRTSKWSLFAHDLPVPPSGMEYQWWLISRGVTLSGGLFLPDETGHAFVAMRRSGHPAGSRVRVTLEPAGGSDQPRGAVVFDDPGVERTQE